MMRLSQERFFLLYLPLVSMVIFLKGQALFIFFKGVTMT